MTDPQPPVPPVPPAPSGGGDTPPPASPVPPMPPTDGMAAPAAPPPAQPQYPAYGQQAPGYYAPPTNTLAIVAMVLSLVGILVGITAIVGAILGHVALGQIKRTGEGGRGFALTGIIAGWVVAGFWLLFIIAYVVILIFAFSAYGAGVATYGY